METRRNWFMIFGCLYSAFGRTMANWWKSTGISQQFPLPYSKPSWVWWCLLLLWQIHGRKHRGTHQKWSRPRSQCSVHSKTSNHWTRVPFQQVIQWAATRLCSWLIWSQKISYLIRMCTTTNSSLLEMMEKTWQSCIKKWTLCLFSRSLLFAQQIS